jgi:glycosyltransferase involved in cell wall biosynthesis
MRILGGLSDLDWQLRIVGGAVDARFLRKVKRLAATLGCRIVYTGVLAGAALQREYREADIFVFPSRYEGFGISLAEAIRAGLPFVAFSSGAISEVSGGRGLLVTPGDLDTFRSHLRRLIEDTAFRGQMAALSRDLAAELPTWEDTGRGFLRAVRRVVGEGS